MGPATLFLCLWCLLLTILLVIKSITLSELENDINLNTRQSSQNFKTIYEHQESNLDFRREILKQSEFSKDAFEKIEELQRTSMDIIKFVNDMDTDLELTQFDVNYLNKAVAKIYVHLEPELKI